MTLFDLAITGDRASTAIAITAPQAINDMKLVRAEDRYPILSCYAAEHCAGFDRVPVPAEIFDDLLDQSDAHAQAWVEGRS